MKHLWLIVLYPDSNDTRVQDCTEDLASYVATASFHEFKKLKLANQLAIGSYIHNQVMGL